MPLAPGTRLGPYEVTAPLGTGGMGEVYRARDTRLGREVAIKVLPEAFAQDADRLTRFEREAKAVAALSHPNIIALFDFGVDRRVAYAVTELLDGKTLRERLTHGALPVRKAIEIAVAIARGLAAAHAKGLIHRDLKPENVFVLGDGQVKILDFGLARQTSTGSGATETVALLTDPGVVMGTVGYMAPEQVRGEAVDARADLFALGAVLYELLSGRRAFKRGTAAETMTAILKDDPPELGGSRADLSPALDRIVRHCLEKNPAERFQTARDVAFALEVLSGSSTALARAVEAPAARRLPRLAIGAGAALVLLGAGYWIGHRSAPATGTPSARFEAKTFDPQAIFRARFAPDGQTIVYASALEGNLLDVFVLRAGSALPQKLGRTHLHLLSISSTGEMAVLTDPQYLGERQFSGTLARMTMDGEARPWMKDVREADWSPDALTLAIVRDVHGMDQLEYPIGTVQYTTPGYVSDVRVSPDGQRVAFFDHQVKFDDRGWVKVVDKSRRVTTLAGEYWAEQGLA